MIKNNFLSLDQVAAAKLRFCVLSLGLLNLTAAKSTSATGALTMCRLKTEI
jgi:hypothetical protein